MLKKYAFLLILSLLNSKDSFGQETNNFEYRNDGYYIVKLLKSKFVEYGFYNSTDVSYDKKYDIYYGYIVKFYKSGEALIISKRDQALYGQGNTNFKYIDDYNLGFYIDKTTQEYVGGMEPMNKLIDYYCDDRLKRPEEYRFDKVKIEEGYTLNSNFAFDVPNARTKMNVVRKLKFINPNEFLYGVSTQGTDKLQPIFKENKAEIQFVQNNNWSDESIQIAIKKVEEEKDNERKIVEEQNRKKQIEEQKNREIQAKNEEINNQKRIAKIKTSSIGDRICFSESWTYTERNLGFFGIGSYSKSTDYSIIVIAYIENIQNGKYQVRVGSVESTNKQHFQTPTYKGVSLREGSIHWINPITDKNWMICE